MSIAMSLKTDASVHNFGGNSSGHSTYPSARVDERLRSLTEQVLPKQPYIVSVPTDVPWRPGSKYYSNWQVGTPFSRDEESLQYLSFIPYQTEDSLLQAIGGWSDENGNLLGEDSQPRPEEPRSGANTPSIGSQRKKITLSAYKNKGRGGSEEVGNEMERAQASIKKADLSFVQRSDSASRTPLTNGSRREHDSLGKKRSHDALDASKHSQMARESSTRPEKKQRTSPRPTQRPNPAGKHSPHNKAEPSIPKLESPTLPAFDDINLPELVSPTLPPVLEELLARNEIKHMTNGSLGHKRADSALSNNTFSSNARYDSDQSPAPSLRVRNLDSPIIKPRSANNTPKITPTKRVEISSAKSQHSDSSHRKDQSLSVKSEKGRASPLSAIKDTVKKEPEPVPRKQLRVILRYGKKNRKRVESLLRFVPRSKKEQLHTGLGIAIRAASTDPPRHPAQKVGPSDRKERDHIQRVDKRPKQDEPDEKPSVRKVPPTLNLPDEKPRTPVPPPFSSPGIQSSFPRSNYSTPKKDMKSSTMRRVESSDGTHDAHTPQGISRNNTPVSTDRHNPISTPQTMSKISPPTSHAALNTSIARDPADARRAWRALHTKYFDLGRKLKHEGSAMSSNRTVPDPSEMKLAAVLWVEALLCFILANYCVDRSSSSNAVDNGWRSTLPYWEFVRSHTKSFTDLHGIVLHLGVLVRNIVHRIDMERLARDPLPDEMAASTTDSSAPTPGSDGTTKTLSEEADKYRKKYSTFKSELVENFQALTTLSADAIRRMSLDRIEERFPSTWAKKVSAATNKERDTQLDPSGSLDGSFSLPLDASSSSLEGVRFGRKVLKEWCKGEGLDWNAKLDL